ncbi:VapE family protein [Methylophilus sp. VKM B-3414]|uniref:VapE domain-containing protein n=1 Tax=Methylophilus sp. VKM B-3414 TaxID=3076121 RepID=UPI0028C6AB1B|nr:VapE domain-containing protein [Methylophilus sp. VKM B-3414]MDT7849932.1 VapE family protein [Methylophilus sp. VKM B-3414]
MAKLTPIPYAEIAQAANNAAESLVRAWLPGGKKTGQEYFVCNPNRADSKPNSFAINISGDSKHIGRWGDFATPDAGTDLISLYAYIFGLEQWEAAIEVADQIGFKLPEGCRPAESQPRERKAPIIDPATIKQSKPKEESPWHPVMPVPAGAEEAPLAHRHRGLPALKWEYKDANGQLLGYVYRFNSSDGGKETLPLTYCKNQKTGKHEWRWMQWPEPNRPIYGLDRLAAKPDAYVLLVEGEKCADAPLDMIQGVPVSWPGGSKAIDKVDWLPLAGRKIYAWPDCDAQREKLTSEEKEQGVDPASKPLLPEEKQPGMLAMLKIRDKLLELDPATEFHIIDIPAPGEKPGGWDIYDAIHDDGMNAAALTAFITKTRPALTLVADNSKEQSTATPADAEKDEKPKWVGYLLRNKTYDITPCLANIVDIIENDERWRGILAFDEFAQRVIKLKAPPFWNNSGEAGEWDTQDDARLAMWITKIWRFSPSTALVAEAVEVAARNNPVNPPRDWLKSLKWDGKKRLLGWMHEYMGVADNEYTQRVGCWFFMGMVKRVFEPGCKFDYCLVIEGPQGRKKSTALAVIGGDWYGDTDLDLHNKDSMSALRGKMLYEFSEMGSVAKAEATKQKSFLSRQVDEYRPVYGRREIRVPRQLVFAGTTNEWEWNKDPTGGRRFWPIEVTTQIDIDGLREVRDQLFAEAVERVNAGQRYWPTQDEQERLFDKEQLKRTITESFVDGIEEWVYQRSGLLKDQEFTLYMVATECLGMDASKISRDIQTRIGNALRQLDCKRVEKRNSEHRFWYKPPERKLATSTTGADASQPQQNPGGG